MTSLANTFKDFHIHAVFHKSEIHPEAKTLKDFHIDIENILASIRQEFPNVNNDPGFMKAADALSKAIPLGKIMESLEPIESGRIEKARARYMKSMGTDGLMEVTGEPSKKLAQAYITLLEKLLNKEYWPDRNCRKDLWGKAIFSIFNQSYISAYEHDFRTFLPKQFQDMINELNVRITNYNKTAAPQI